MQNCYTKYISFVKNQKNQDIIEFEDIYLALQNLIKAGFSKLLKTFCFHFMIILKRIDCKWLNKKT